MQRGRLVTGKNSDWVGIIMTKHKSKTAFMIIVNTDIIYNNGYVGHLKNNKYGLHSSNKYLKLIVFYHFYEYSVF